MLCTKIISQKEIHKLAVQKGWWETHREVPELLALIHSEISEALEAHRNKIPEGKKGWLGEELADAVIRIFDMAEYYGIDIAQEVKKKHLKNTMRPYRHGGKTC
jgi:NTP pyrophosphatase (non-canonical NTP hydrolase)